MSVRARGQRGSWLALLGLAAFGAACHCGAPSPPPAPASGAAIATCAKAVGDVQVRRAGQPFFEALATGSVLRAGDWVRTGDHAYTRLAFLAGGELELLERAAVVVDVTTVAPIDGGAPVASPEIALKEGFVRGTLGGASPMSRLVIKAKDGTELRLSPRSFGVSVSYRLEQRGDSLDVAVLQGEGTLTVGGVERTVRAGEVSAVQAGASTPAVPLIDFPESVEPGIDARFLFSPKMNIRLTWAGVKGAASYEVQIARDLSFQEIESTAETTGTGFNFTPAHGGVYAWRVASREAGGRLGEYGFARRVFCEEQQPKDLLLAPADGFTLAISEATSPVSFSWQSAAETLSYRLVISRTDDLLKQPLVDRLIGDQRIQITGLAPGSYSWGVFVFSWGTSAASDVSRPIFLKPRHFTIKHVAAAHLKTVKTINEWGK